MSSPASATASPARKAPDATLHVRPVPRANRPTSAPRTTTTGIARPRRTRRRLGTMGSEPALPNHVVSTPASESACPQRWAGRCRRGSARARSPSGPRRPAVSRNARRRNHERTAAPGSTNAARRLIRSFQGVSEKPPRPHTRRKERPSWPWRGDRRPGGLRRQARAGSWPAPGHPGTDEAPAIPAVEKSSANWSLLSAANVEPNPGTSSVAPAASAASEASAAPTAIIPRIRHQAAMTRQISPLVRHRTMSRFESGGIGARQGSVAAHPGDRVPTARIPAGRLQIEGDPSLVRQNDLRGAACDDRGVHGVGGPHTEDGGEKKVVERRMERPHLVRRKREPVLEVERRRLDVPQLVGPRSRRHAEHQSGREDDSRGDDDEEKERDGPAPGHAFRSVILR